MDGVEKNMTEKKSVSKAVSICIIYKQTNPYLIECLNNCSALDFDDFEVLLFPDAGDDIAFEKSLKKYNFPVRIIPTGKLNIPQKRNICIENSNSEFIAFIDDDAYPTKDWLKSAIPFFNDSRIGAVGGPNMTPPNDPYLRRIPGNFMKSKLGFGGGYIRHTRVSERYVNELPTCNLIVRKNLLEKVKFDVTLVAGEDTRMCFDIINLGYKVFYSPEVIVYHHRRRLFMPFLKQLFNYGYFRGVQLKNKEVRHIWYLVPAIFFIYVITGFFFSFFSDLVRMFFIATLSVYLIIMLIEAIRTARILEVPLTWIIFFMAHLTYGYGLIYGYLSRN